MDIEKIIESACAKATLQFNRDFREECHRLAIEENKLGIWGHSDALNSTIPIMIKNILLDIFQEIDVHIKESTDR